MKCWVSAATDSCNVVTLFQTKKKEGKKTQGSWKEKESFVLQSVGSIFYSIKAEIGKGSAFGSIYPSLRLCRVWMNCSVSHGDRSELCWRLKSAYVVFTLSSHALFCTQSLFCQAPQCWVNSNKNFSVSHLSAFSFNWNLEIIHGSLSDAIWYMSFMRF